MKKRILSLLLAFLMVVSVFPTTRADETGDNCPYCDETMANDGTVIHSDVCTAAYVYDGTGDVDQYVTLNPESAFSVSDDPENDEGIFFFDYEFGEDTVMRITDWYWDMGNTALWYQVELHSGAFPESTEDFVFPEPTWILHRYTDSSYDGYPEVFAFSDVCPISGTADCDGHTSTDPSDPVDPENPCACCESCTGAEGCDCGCDNCDFCQQQKEPTLSDTFTDAEGNEQTVTVTCETLPEGVNLEVDQADVGALLNEFKIPADRLVCGLSISLIRDGADYQPETSVLVKVPVDAEPGTLIGILHTHEGVTSHMGFVEVEDDRTVEFETDGFSEFTLYTVVYIYQNGTKNYSHYFKVGETASLAGILNSINGAFGLGLDIKYVNSVECNGVTATKVGDDYILSCENPFDGVLVCKIIFRSPDNVTEATVVEFSVKTKPAFTLTLNPNGGTISGGSITVSLGETFYSDMSWKIPVRAGYRFDGWFTDESAGEQVYKSDGFFYHTDDEKYWNQSGAWQFEGDLTLYAHWTPINYTATFIVNGETKETIQFTIEDDISLPTSTDISNERLCTWVVTEVETGSNWAKDAIYKLRGSDNKPLPDGYTIPKGKHGNVTLTATLAQIISFNYNGGFRDNDKDKINDNEATAAGPYDVVKNETFMSSVDWLNPERTGYTFAGWFDAASGGEAVYGANGFSKEGSYWTSSGKWIGTADLTIYAQWTPKEYTVNYHANGGDGTMSPQQIVFGSEFAINNNAFEAPEGKRFVGWGLSSTGAAHEGGWSNADGTGYSGTWNWDNGQYGIANDTLNLYAIWDDATYTVTWKNGDEVLQTDTVTHGGSATYTGSEPTREAETGYQNKFTGWDKGTDGTVSNVTTDTVVNAQFTKSAVEYTITYVLGDGTNHKDNPGSYTIESSTITLKDPTPPEGYVFLRWQEGNSIPAGSTGVKTFTAVYAKTYVVTFRHLRADSTDSLYADTTVRLPAGTVISDLSQYALTENSSYVFYTSEPASYIVTTESDQVVNLFYKITTAEYTVEVYREKLDGTYEKVKTDVKTGTVGSNVTADHNAYKATGFVPAASGNVASGKVTADGKLTLKLYFDREKYQIIGILDGEEVSRQEVKYGGSSDAITFIPEDQFAIASIMENDTSVAVTDANKWEYTYAAQSDVTKNITVTVTTVRAKADLTIKVAGSRDSDQSFVFTVTDSNGTEVAKMIIPPTVSEITIKDLPVDTYTVTPVSGWAWRLSYTVANNGQVLLDSRKTVEFTWTKIGRLIYWLNGYSYGKGD